MINNSPDCKVEGHQISFVIGSKRDIPPEEIGGRTNDASGEGYIGCINCRLPVDRIDIESKRTPIAG